MALPETLVLIAKGPEDIVRCYESRARKDTYTLLPNLVGDQRQELLAADPVVHSGEQVVENLAGHLAASNLLQKVLPDLGPGRETETIGFVFENQGVNEVSILGAAKLVSTARD